MEAAKRVAQAPARLEASGFPGPLASLNGVFCLRQWAWNRYPAWQKMDIDTKPDMAPVYLYRDSTDTKWVLGLNLGDGHSRVAHVYTSFSNPAVGLVWELDCGDRWREYYPATVHKQATVAAS